METEQTATKANAQFCAQPLEVSMANVSALSFLAERMALTPAHARALPAVIERCARKVGLAQDELIRSAWDDAPLRNYLASICANADVQAVLQ